MKRLLWAALALGLVLRAGYAWHAHHKAYIPTDSDGYETIALNLLSGGGYSYEAGKPTSHREPGFPFLIAAVYAASGGRAPGVFLALQCLMSVLVGWLAFAIGRRLFDERAGVLAAAAWCLYPQAIYYSGYYFRETFAALMVTGLVLASLQKTDRSAVAAGLFGMGAALTNSGLLPAAILCSLAFRRRRLILYALPIVAGCGLWTARNYSVQGRIVLGSTHGGEELYQALIVPPDELGTARQTEIIAEDAEFHAADGMSEGERNAHLTRASLHWIAAHPGLYASRAVAGLAKFWKLWPYKRRYDHGYAALVLASLFSDGWLVPLGLWGLWLFRRKLREAPVPWIVVGATWLLYGLVHAVIRYRVPLMPTLAVFAAAALFHLFGKIRPGKAQ